MIEEAFFDIETLPVHEGPMLDVFMATVKPPGNIKKPESIQAWLLNEDNMKEARLKTSFDALYGSICSISVAIGDDKPKCFTATNFSRESEKEIILAFLEAIRDQDNKQRTLVGHYIKDFDIPFMSKRMLLHGLGSLFPFGQKPWDMNAQCTHEMFGCGTKDSASLHNLCMALGVKTPKGDLDGSMIYLAFLDGEFDRIAKYNNEDVVSMRECYRRMTARV